MKNLHFFKVQNPQLVKLEQCNWLQLTKQARLLNQANLQKLERSKLISIFPNLKFLKKLSLGIQTFTTVF